MHTWDKIYQKLKFTNKWHINSNYCTNSTCIPYQNKKNKFVINTCIKVLYFRVELSNSVEHDTVIVIHFPCFLSGNLPKSQVFLCRIILISKIFPVLPFLSRNISGAMPSEEATSIWKCPSLPLSLKKSLFSCGDNKTLPSSACDCCWFLPGKNQIQWNCPGTFPGCSCNFRQKCRGESITCKKWAEENITGKW